MITPSLESTTTTTVSSSCIMNTAAAADHNNSENRFSIANCAIESNNRTTITNKRVATHQCTNVDRQPILPSQQRTVRYINHEHHITDQHMTSSLSIQTINSNKAEVPIRKEEEEEDFDKHTLLTGRRLHRIKRRLFLQLTVPSIPSTLLTSNSLSSSSASACCSTTSLVLTVE
jgi:hypothetical protein